jgi:hypothetical protein
MISYILRETALKSTRCCISLRKPSMNKLYRLPLRTRAKNLSSGVRRRQSSSKILTTALLAFGALVVLAVLGFAAVFTFKHVFAKHKAVAAAAPSPVATPSPAVPSLKPKEILLPLADPNKPSPEATASARPSATPQPSPAVLFSTAAAPTPAATVPRATRVETPPKETDKPLTKAARKVLERNRLEAEHKRARLEKAYQNHEISLEAYNKGKEEYKVEIQKYRAAIKTSD